MEEDYDVSEKTVLEKVALRSLEHDDYDIDAIAANLAARVKGLPTRPVKTDAQRLNRAKESASENLELAIVPITGDETKEPLVTERVATRSQSTAKKTVEKKTYTKRGRKPKTKDVPVEPLNYVAPSTTVLVETAGESRAQTEKENLYGRFMAANKDTPVAKFLKRFNEQDLYMCGRYFPIPDEDFFIEPYDVLKLQYLTRRYSDRLMVVDIAPSIAVLMYLAFLELGISTENSNLDSFLAALTVDYPCLNTLKRLMMFYLPDYDQHRGSIVEVETYFENSVKAIEQKLQRTKEFPGLSVILQVVTCVITNTSIILDKMDPDLQDSELLRELCSRICTNPDQPLIPDCSVDALTPIIDGFENLARSQEKALDVLVDALYDLVKGNAWIETDKTILESDDTSSDLSNRVDEVVKVDRDEDMSKKQEEVTVLTKANEGKTIPTSVSASEILNRQVKEDVAGAGHEYQLEPKKLDALKTAAQIMEEKRKKREAEKKSQQSKLASGSQQRKRARHNMADDNKYPSFTPQAETANLESQVSPQQAASTTSLMSTESQAMVESLKKFMTEMMTAHTDKLTSRMDTFHDRLSKLEGREAISDKIYPPQQSGPSENLAKKLGVPVSKLMTESAAGKKSISQSSTPPTVMQADMKQSKIPSGPFDYQKAVSTFNGNIEATIAILEEVIVEVNAGESFEALNNHICARISQMLKDTPFKDLALREKWAVKMASKKGRDVITKNLRKLIADLAKRGV